MWCLMIFSLLLILLHYVNAQPGTADKINFDTMPAWPDLCGCVQVCFDRGWYVSPVYRVVQCGLNACLCRPDILSQGIAYLSSEVLVQCLDTQDQSIAVSVLLSYCSAKGYTSAPVAVSATTTDAYTATSTVTVYVTVTQYVTMCQSSAESHVFLRLRSASLAVEVFLIALCLCL
jgi:hypothetical protein